MLSYRYHLLRNRPQTILNHLSTRRFLSPLSAYKGTSKLRTRPRFLSTTLSLYCTFSPLRLVSAAPSFSLHRTFPLSPSPAASSPQLYRQPESSPHPTPCSSNTTLEPIRRAVPCVLYLLHTFVHSAYRESDTELFAEEPRSQTLFYNSIGSQTRSRCSKFIRHSAQASRCRAWADAIWATSLFSACTEIAWTLSC